MKCRSCRVSSYLLILILFTLNDCQSDDKFGSAPRSQQAIERKQVTIRCLAVERALKSMQYDDVTKMEWRKDGRVVAYYSKSPNKVESWVSDAHYFLDRSQFSLIIDQTRLDDRGYYKCWPRFRVMPPHSHHSHWRTDLIALSVIGLPSRPGRPVVLSYASRNALISWTAGVSHVEAAILRYIIKMRKTDNVEREWEETVTGNGTSWLVNDLQPLSTYRFQVQAENTVGPSQFSPPSYPIRTRGEAPSVPPRILSVYNSTERAIVVTWTAPPLSSLYGALVAYRLTAKTVDTPHKQRQFHLKPDLNTFEIADLVPYTKYMITLEGENIFGYSPPATIRLLTAEGVPSTGPAITSITVQSQSEVTIEYSAPTITRGLLTHYTVYYRAINKARKGKPESIQNDENFLTMKIGVDWTHKQKLVSSYNLSGLEPCTQYSIRLSASTSRGESVPSDSHYFVTDSFAPSNPTLFNVTAVGVDSVYVEWLPPTEYCVDVDFYLIILINERLQQRQYNTSETHAVLGDLKPLTRYAITIRAATRCFLISDRPRYYVGAESVNLQFLLIASPVIGSTELLPTLKVAFCPSRNAGLVSAPLLHRLWRDSSDYFGTFRCDYPMSAANNTIGIGRDTEAEPQSSSSSKSSVSVVAVAVLGTFGLLILLVLLVMALVHLWRRYFGGKDCLAYAAEAFDSNLRNNNGDLESVGTDADSIAVEDFVDYVRSMHSDSDSGFARLYERIEQTCSSSDMQKLAYEHSVMPQNKMKNRYVNILPYDHSRVRLRSLPGSRNSDYINANFVDGYRQKRVFITTQGPLPNTLADFWRMVWEQRCRVIVMITNIVERGRKKCEQYWPSEGEETYGAYAVSLLNERVTAFYTIRTMALRCLKKKTANDEPNRIVMQFHCTCWADHGVPESASAILKFIEKSKQANHDPTAPIIVHCSAGVGRSGTYIVIDSILQQMRTSGRLNVCGFLKHIRHQRMCLVQTEEQFIFCYDALAEAVLLGETEIHARDFRRLVSDSMAETDSNSSLALQKQYQRMMIVKASSCSEAKKPWNMQKNRENAPVPTDEHRVVITAIPGETGSDYINATFLPGYHRLDEFIVTQFPQQEIATSFWRMVWDHNCRTVVLLTQPNQAYQSFWPQSDSSDAQINVNSFSVSLLSTESAQDEGWNNVDVLLRSSGEDLQLLCRMICVDWPRSREQFDQVWRLVHAVQQRQSSQDCGPLVVVDELGGCAAATFCLLSALNCQLDQESCVDVYTLARCYHQGRSGVFPQFADYLYIFDCLNWLITSYESNGKLDSPESSSQSRSLPSSVRARSIVSLTSRPASCNGYCSNVPKDTTL